MKRVSPAYEDYLEAIYELCRDSGSVRSVDVAEKLNVSKASVSKAIKALKSAELVEQPYYGDITLTQDGAKYGAAVLERHHMLRSFLTQILGVDVAVAEDEACEMEHAISDETLQRWSEYLKEQGLDPASDTSLTNALHQRRSKRKERNAIASTEGERTGQTRSLEPEQLDDDTVG